MGTKKHESKMSQFIEHNSKLWEHRTQNGSLFEFFCPACRNNHSFETPRWTFNGNVDKPTFKPSLRLLNDTDVILCHLNLTDGLIFFHGDCPHDLAGKTVPMEDL
jgi:hypothetical protein